MIALQIFDGQCPSAETAWLQRNAAKLVRY
jgi:hypothetical protein